MKKKYFTEEEKKEAIKLKNKKAYKQNKSWHMEYAKINKEIRKKYHKEWFKQNNSKEIKETNPEKIKELNRIKKNEYQKNRKQNDNLYKLSANLRSYICNSLKNKNYKKNTKTFDIIGCSNIEFKIYLESKFESWMNWDNYGKYNGTEEYGWDIDHIIPLSSATCENDILKLNHHSNLQPLCSYFNRRVKINNHLENLN